MTEDSGALFQRQRTAVEMLGDSLKIVGVADFLGLFLYFAHLKIDLTQSPSQSLLLVWVLGVIIVMVGIAIQPTESSPPSEKSPQEQAGA